MHPSYFSRPIPFVFDRHVPSRSFQELLNCPRLIRIAGNVVRVDKGCAVLNMLCTTFVLLSCILRRIMFIDPLPVEEIAQKLWMLCDVVPIGFMDHFAVLESQFLGTSDSLEPTKIAKVSLFRCHVPSIAPSSPVELRLTPGWIDVIWKFDIP